MCWFTIATLISFKVKGLRWTKWVWGPCGRRGLNEGTRFWRCCFLFFSFVSTWIYRDIGTCVFLTVFVSYQVCDSKMDYNSEFSNSPSLKISSSFQKLLGAFGRIDKLYSLSELLQGIPSDLQEEHSCFHYPNQEVHGDALQVLPFPENNRLPNRRQSSVILRFRIDVIFLRNRSGYQGLCFVSSMISHSRNINPESKGLGGQTFCRFT